MRVIEDIRELIGNTPLMRLRNIGAPEHVSVYAKLELMNPGGGVKDRIGLEMLEEAREKGLIRPGSTIIEPTAGNTGLGLALAALHQGYRLLLVVPEKFSEEKQILMQALGAEIVQVSAAEGMEGAIALAEDLHRSIPDSYIPNQFTNPANVRAHRKTGQEIYCQLQGRVDLFVAGAGTGGTFTGVVSYLKERNPGLHAVLADPFGSTLGGGECGSYRIEGIGNHFVPEVFDPSLVDEVIKVTDEEAYQGAKLLARQEGLLVGSSSGANLAAALKLAARPGVAGSLVTVFYDRSERYFSKQIYG